MTLWDMLDKALYYQKVQIYETNAYDQNMLIFKGKIQEARQDTDKVWDYLMCNVKLYEYHGDVLVIYVADEYYDERMEGHYLYSDKWTETNRPWKRKLEIEKELNNKALS